MAEALRLQIEYKDINQVDTRIEVWQDGYAGAAKYLTYANDEVASEFTWGDTSTKQLPLVYGSKVTMKFDSETDFEFFDFFTSNSRKNKILIYKNNSLFHASFGEADAWDEPFIPAPYEVQFTGYDGLGLLKNEDFKDENKDYYEGEMTPLAILQLILSKTGLSLPLNTCTTIRPSVAASGADALTQVLKDVYTYRDMNCYDVLQALFKGNRIFQRNGEWWIISNDKWGSASITCYNYTAEGAANGTVDINTRTSGFWFEDIGRLNFLPALKQMTAVQDYGYLGNIIKNNNFLSFDDGVFENWTAVGITPAQRLYDGDGNRYVYLNGAEYTYYVDTPRTKYLKSAGIRLEASDSIATFSLDYALINALRQPGVVLFGIHLQADDGTHYNLKLDLDRTVNPHELIHVWEQTSGLYAIPCEDKEKIVKGSNNNYAIGQTTEGWPKDEVTEHFETKAIQIKEGIPKSGTLTIYLFLPYTLSAAAGGACFRNVEFKFLDKETEEEPPAETEFTLVNDLGNNYTPDEVSIINGSLPEIDNRLAIYHGGFILNDGSGAAVDTWAWDGGGVHYGYAETIVRFIAAEMRLPRLFHKAKFADLIPTLKMVFSEAHTGKLYAEAGITYNDRMQTIDGRYIEVVDFSLEFASHRTDHFSDRRTTGTTSRSGTTRNRNDETGLYDEDYNRVNTSGRLSSNEFEDITDANTGRTVLLETINRTFVEQVAHNFDIGTAIRYDRVAETYVLAQADSEENARGMRIVSEVIDDDNFAFKAAGKVYDNTLTAGKTYVLSPTTAGAIVDIDSVVNWPDGSVKVKVGTVSEEALVVNIDQVGETSGTTIITGNATLTVVPSGVINGVNTVFILPQVPSIGSVRVYYQGQRLTPGVDYTINGDTITFTNAPRTNSSILVDYHAQSTTAHYNVVPSGTINGANTVFTLPEIPATLAVYYQGQRLTPGVDYTLSDDTITFTNPPRTGSSILCDYET